MATQEEKARAEAEAKLRAEAATKASEREAEEQARLAKVESAKEAADSAKQAADSAKQAATTEVKEAAIRDVVAATSDFVIKGTPGGVFEVWGKGFSDSGSVLVNGKAQKTTGWGDTYITGVLDADVTSGEAVIPIDEKTKLVGYLKV